MHTLSDFLAASLAVSEIINQVGSGERWWHPLLNGADVVNPLQLSQTGALQPVPVCCLGNGVFPFLEHWRNRAALSPTSVISTLQGHTEQVD